MEEERRWEEEVGRTEGRGRRGVAVVDEEGVEDF